MSNVLDTVRFRSHVLRRTLAVAPRSNKKIKMLYIEYVNPGMQAPGLVQIKYRFRNALWYTVNGKKTINTRVALRKNEIGEEAELTVHGFLRKNTYTLLFKPDYIHVIRITQD